MVEEPEVNRLEPAGEKPTIREQAARSL